MKDKLTPVGCIGLFGRASTLMKRGAMPTSINLQAPTKPLPRDTTSPNLQRNAERDNLPDAPRSLPTREHYRASLARRNCFSFVRRNVQGKREQYPSTLLALQAAERPN